FLYVVTLAYAVLIPQALAMGSHWARSRRRGLGRVLGLAGIAATATAVVVVSCVPLGVLESGALGATTQPAPEPDSLVEMSAIIDQDATPGAVLWFGQPLVRTTWRNRHFLVASPTHPAVNLKRTLTDTRINRR